MIPDPPGSLRIMSYIEGFVIPVKDQDKAAYEALARSAWPVFKEYGALQVVETWSDDVKDGKVTDFKRAVLAEPGESIVFSWILWPSKEVREAAGPKLMADPRMEPKGPMPFDMKRMIVGGFAVLFDSTKP